MAANFGGQASGVASFGVRRLPETATTGQKVIKCCKEPHFNVAVGQGFSAAREAQPRGDRSGRKRTEPSQKWPSGSSFLVKVATFYVKNVPLLP